MTAKYFAILTNQGAARLANAAALGTKLNLTQMAVGDANGTLPTPDPAQTKLINQKRIAPLNLLTVDPANTSQIIAEQIIPENEGGFWIREIGLYDDDGILIAVANCPETYKPLLAEGSGRTQTIRMILVVSSTSAITLKIDPSVVLATRKYVDDAVIEVKGYVDGLMRNHEQSRNHPDATTTAKGFTQLNSSVTDDRETQSATPKAVKIAMDNANARLAKERNLADLPNPALARQNLQLGDSSTKNTGTTANTVAAGDDARITGAMQKSQNGADIQDVAKFLQNLGLGDDARLSGNLTVKGGVWDTAPGDTPERVWSPNNKPSLATLGVLDATTTQKGIVELATNAEMATGSSQSLVPSVSAVMSIFSKRSFSANDYVRIPDVPGGLIIQWVSGNASASGVFFAQMPIPFPNKLLFAGAVEAGANVWGTDSATTWGIDFANSSLSQVIAYARRIFPTTVTQEAAAGLVIAIGN
ncbi:phage tail protein [Salmonella enterica subsp. enterica serovar Alachua]|uniref:phage tail protein n=7 Tax=Salmonella enterica TaxID=28901 RepID=UPI001EFBE167|nr:phage tail protein [Salmonella enterica]MDJ8079891.1 phage tail protein [Salmonella enterica]WMZ99760.1 phage tail protein [Salmonella enterica subsp. enterica serovar Alachua]